SFSKRSNKKFFVSARRGVFLFGSAHIRSCGAEHIRNADAIAACRVADKNVCESLMHTKTPRLNLQLRRCILYSICLRTEQLPNNVILRNLAKEIQAAARES
ncbi:MAG: hypothetical protein LUC06_01235, partial [Oscillospiraceae bacterium]|nr:hypothetical protein [Oscillospiraceae bacterium]